MLYASSAIFFANCTSKKLGKIFDKVKVDIVCFIRCPQDQKTVCVYVCIYISSVQSVSRAWLFAIPWAAARQASLSITNSQRCSNSCPSSRWCHPTTSSSIVPFSSCLQFFPAWGSFPMSQFFASGGQSIEASASASVLPVNIQDWFPLRLSGLTWENHICVCVCMWFVPSKNLTTELTQNWGNRLLEGTNKTLCPLGPARKEQWPYKRLTQTCLWASRCL